MFLLPKTSFIIRETKSKGRGVFAAENIPSGTVIGDYLGKVISIRDYDPQLERGMYLMAFGNAAFIYPDMSQPGIYLINHACRPNAWMYVYRGHTLFFALVDIASGDEITISYLLSPMDESCTGVCEHVCYCGSLYCRGTMHLSASAYKKWQAFLLREKRKTSMAPYAAGSYLSKLSSYPASIPTDPIYEAVMTDKNES